jgi:beta-glucosidase
VASYTRPVRELKNYKRVTLAPGEAKQVEFKLKTNELGFYKPDGSYVVEPGAFQVWVAPNAAEGLQKDFKIEE